MRHLELSTGWQVRRHTPESAAADESGWIAASVPGSAHEALMAANQLQDPFIGLNEEGAQWVGECDWMFRCSFDVPAELLDEDAVALCCDGLDTFATVWLNGEQVIASDNMFIPQRAEVRQLLRAEGNELRILCESALRIGREREAAHTAMHVWNGEASRVYVRKAQYHYGWDWGPTLLACGPWLPVRLEAYSARIAELHCTPALGDDGASVHVWVAIDDAGGAALPLGAQHAAHRIIARMLLHGPDGALIGAASVAVDDASARHTFAISSPQRWWPAGYGEQPLYTVEVALERGQEQLDQRQLRIGLRTVELAQEPIEGEPGKTFMFRVNGTPIFCGGANWIPADSFVNQIAPARYRELVRLAAEANMVMLRVWGGGLYEMPAFYEACDELGVLVWQDFMFACGLYPADGWFVESVRAEAEAQVRRLRHHACMALWCGNNEDYQIADSFGRYREELPPEQNPEFPARMIYERLLPEVCAALDPGRPYWPGSPYVGKAGSSPTEGDRHTWDIWHGVVAPYQEYPSYGGRFVSEFGMQALPDMSTIESFTTPDERFPGSRTIEHHNKAAGGIRRIAAYLADNLRPVESLDDYIYATQLIQAEAIASAYRGWRRRWGGPGRYSTAGALVWQINDCWPVTSWAIVDYYLRPKPAYYVLRRELAPLSIGLAQAPDGAQVWVVNGAGAAQSGRLELRTWTLEGDLLGVERADVTLPANQASELGVFGLSGGTVVIDARLLIDGRVAARAALWPEPYKYLHLPDPMIVMDLDGAETIRLRAVRPAKAVLLSAGDGVEWSDNMIDLMPDDEQIVTASGLGEQPVQIRWLQ